MRIADLCISAVVVAFWSLGVHATEASGEAFPDANARTEGPTAIRLSAPDVARRSLVDGQPIQLSAKALVLQARRLAQVSRAAFQPKVGLAANSALNRDGSVGGAQLSRQSQVNAYVAWSLPTGATVTASRSVSRDVGAGIVAPRTAGAATLSLVQPLLKGAGREVAEAPMLTAESAFRVAAAQLRQSAMLRVVQALTAYADAHQARATVAQARDQLASAQRLHEANTALAKAGRIARIALVQSKTDISTAQLGLERAEQAERVALRNLAAAMGRSNAFDRVEVVLSGGLEDATQSSIDDERDIVAQALRSSPALVAAEESVKQAAIGVRLARNDLLPTLNLTASHSTGSGDSSSPSRTSVGIVAEFSFDRAELRIASQSAQLALESAREDLLTMQQAVAASASDARRNLVFANAQHVLANEAMDLAAQQLENQIELQRLGRVSQFELSSAHRALGSARLQVLEAASQVFRSRLELEQVAGALLKRWGVEDVVAEWVAGAELELKLR